MKHYVITIKELPQSVEYAERCIRSGSRHGLMIEMFDAITPQNTDIVAKMKVIIAPINMASLMFHRNDISFFIA